MADVFISYKRERRPAARHLEQILIRYGYTVWFDLALVRGKDYEAQIERELTAAKAVIVLWCGLSVASEGVRSEASRAKSDGKLIPLVIEPCKLPLFSTLEQNIDLTDAAGSPRDPALDPVLDDLERLVGRPPHSDLRALRDYEATWRSMGSLSLARFPLEQAIAAEAVIGGGAGRDAEASAGSKSVIGRLFGSRPRPETQSGSSSAPDQVRAPLARSAPERSGDGRVKVDAKIVHGAPDGLFMPGAGRTEWFKDLDLGPEMVVVPPGSFIMGSSETDAEKPPHEVTIRAPFAVGRFAVAFEEWDAAGLQPKPEDQGWGRGWRPVINVSWQDAKAYAAWLSKTTGKAYRLLSEAEWEYCCRAGTTTAYWWGDSITTEQANYNNERKQTVPVDSFEPNPWGLYQVHGNVWEWCEDNWHLNYQGGPPLDGSVWPRGDVSLRVLRGGAWLYHSPGLLRSAVRSRIQPSDRYDGIGLRVARTL
jgi:formylglycine-generating enzyme required for sulfatase activity